jgi:phage terminase large subunit
MTAKAVIHITKEGFTPYGGASTLFYSRAPEVILSGPYDTGKTITALQKMNWLMANHVNARGLMVRKTYKSLIQSAVVTFERKVHKNRIDEGNYPIEKFGGEKPEWYDYPNGARLVCGGLDNPGKTLSSEYDFIYVNQAEELTEDEWQSLTRAASGRAGNAPYAQVFGDCNPDVPEHWILHRERLLFLESRHEDNPEIYDQDSGELIAPERMETLEGLTGVRYKRGRLGLWVGREGQVYEFDPYVHLLDRDHVAILPEWRRYRVIDFGLRNPFVCQWWAIDNDDRLFRYREIYMTGRTVNKHAKLINELSGNERYEATVADHDAEDRATLDEHGIFTIPADKRITPGIEAVQERLETAADGRPRLFLLRDSLWEVDYSLKDGKPRRPTSTEEEFPGYVWPETKARRAVDERPIKSDDHGMDCIRYLVMHIDGGMAGKPSTRKYR